MCATKFTQASLVPQGFAQLWCCKWWKLRKWIVESYLSHQIHSLDMRNLLCTSSYVTTLRCIKHITLPCSFVNRVFVFFGNINPFNFQQKCGTYQPHIGWLMLSSKVSFGISGAVSWTPKYWCFRPKTSRT